jgi:diphthamide synthase (EF-2-diphthine--ammonia ligase)
MHAVGRSLVEAQAKAAGIPLWNVDLPWPCSNDDYECIMKETCKAAVQAGIECIAFGDLFLTDIQAYREKQLENSGLQLLFPVWGMATRELAPSMIKSGVRAKLTCVDPKLLIQKSRSTIQRPLARPSGLGFLAALLTNVNLRFHAETRFLSDYP